MIETISKKTGAKIKALAIYQIVFGLSGFALTLWLMITQGYSILLLGMCMVFLMLYAHSIYSGILLFKQKDAALIHSLINQYLQLISFSIMGFAYKYVAGIFINVGIDLTNGYLFTFNAGLTTWNMQIDIPTSYIIVNCNLVALALIIFINRLKKKKLLEEEILVLTIGEEVVNN